MEMEREGSELRKEKGLENGKGEKWKGSKGKGKEGKGRGGKRGEKRNNRLERGIGKGRRKKEKEMKLLKI